MNLRLCTNLERLSQMAEIIWLHHYPAIIGYTQTAYMLQRNYSLASLNEQLTKDQMFYWITNEKDIEIGFLGISRLKSDGLFIHKFYILPEFQGKGVGKSVFLLLLALYPEIRSITLQVNRQNYKSVNFYFSVGFKIIQVADFDIGEGWQMNDFIMEWKRN
ncbi:MAG: GNAT family N-acetyltransferase [Bacteroidia bacterium]